MFKSLLALGVLASISVQGFCAEEGYDSLGGPLARTRAGDPAFQAALAASLAADAQAREKEETSAAAVSAGGDGGAPSAPEEGDSESEGEDMPDVLRSLTRTMASGAQLCSAIFYNSDGSYAIHKFRSVRKMLAAITARRDQLGMPPVTDREKNEIYKRGIAQKLIAPGMINDFMRLPEDALLSNPTYGGFWVSLQRATENQRKKLMYSYPAVKPDGEFDIMYFPSARG